MNKSIKQIFTKIFALTLAVAIIFCINVPVSAAVTPSKTSAYAGQVITLKYKYSGIAGISGTFEYSNPGLFSDVKFNIEGLTGVYNEKNKTLAYFGTEPVNCTITLTLTVSKNAKIGDSCNISLEYETTTDGNMSPVPNYKYDKCTVSIVEKLDFTNLKAVVEKAEGLKKSLYTTESWANVETALKAAKTALNKAKTQSEIDSAEKTLRNAINSLEKLPDYSELEKQIKIAQSLNKADYTAKTWDVLEQALTEAKKAQSYKKQVDIDAAAKALKSAIAGLVSIYEGKLNYDELNKQISAAEGLKASDYASDGWQDFINALQNARKARNSKLQPEIDVAAADLKATMEALTKMDYQKLLEAIKAIDDYIKDNKFLNLWEESQGLLRDADNALSSRNQQTVDTYTQKLIDLLAQLKKAINDTAGADTVVVEKPIPVEPTDDYCNIKFHIVWIILFFVSFAVNIALGALIFMYFNAKRKKATDDTPLVDYDITDDFE